MTIPDHRQQATAALTAASNRTYEIVKTLDAAYRKRHELPNATTTVLIFGNLYTESQMREYGQQCREAALKDAAELCNGEQWRNEGKVSVAYIKAFNEGCVGCEGAVRGLK